MLQFFSQFLPFLTRGYAKHRNELLWGSMSLIGSYRRRLKYDKNQRWRTRKNSVLTGERLLNHTKTYFLLFEFHFKFYQLLLSWKQLFGHIVLWFKYEIAQFTTAALLERLRSIVFNKLYTDSSEGRLWIHELHNSQQ